MSTISKSKWVEIAAELWDLEPDEIRRVLDQNEDCKQRRTRFVLSHTMKGKGLRVEGLDLPIGQGVPH